MKVTFMALCLLFCFTSVATGSGTYRPPSVPRIPGFSTEQLKKGKSLFEGAGFVGENGQSCAGCHGRKKDQSFKRSSLKKLKGRLPEEIVECIDERDRCNGSAIPESTENSPT